MVNACKTLVTNVNIFKNHQQSYFRAATQSTFHQNPSDFGLSEIALKVKEDSKTV
jgi:hypothetical protein